MYRFSWENDSNRWDDAEYITAESREDDEFEDVEIDDSYEGDENDF